MSELELRLPTLQHKQEAEHFKNDFFEVEENLIYGSALFDKMEYEKWLVQNTNNRHESTVGSNWVVATTFFAVRKRDQKIVGMIDIRHNLKHDFLSQYGGHIGYSVRPGERKKGYATEMLKEGLEYVKSLNIEKVMVSCYADNIPSIKTIEKFNGVLSEVKPYPDGKLINIYWINLIKQK
jgi:predicted acetyltransferase